jgi:hypothetical protein
LVQADGGNIRNRWPTLRFYKAQLDRLQAAIARVAICAHRCTLHHRASLCNNKCETRRLTMSVLRASAAVARVSKPAPGRELRRPA